MKKFRMPTQEETGVLIAMLAVIFGGWVRLFIPAMAGFPVNDGGLFYVMIRALQENDLRLPTFVQYNGLSIPFAYPPLGFYIGAILSDLLRVSPIEVLRWLPAIVLTLAIVAFYFLAKAVLESSFKAGIATLMYAFTPRAILWPVMGGGLTRSFGLLFMILALASIYRLFTKTKARDLLISIFLSTLVVVTHPEAALQTAGFGLLFWAFKGRNKKATLNAIEIGVGTFALSAIWWAPLLHEFGLDPWRAAAQSGSPSILGILFPVLAVLTDEPLMTLIAVLGLIGVVIRIAQKDYLLPVAYLLPFLVEPRSSPTYAMIPLALLGGVALTDLILPGLTNIEGGLHDFRVAYVVQSRTAQVFIFIVGLYLLGSTFVFDTQVAGTTVSPSDREAFTWIRSNTPANGRFLVLTGITEIFCDGVSEWFPALTDRVSATTVQGNEWLRGKFSAAAQTQAVLQNCISQNDALSCIKEKTKQTGIQYNYVYIDEYSSMKNSCRVITGTRQGESMVSSLKMDEQYSLVYQTQDVTIFSFQP